MNTKMNKKYMFVEVLEKEDEYGYKYIVKNMSLSYTAFKTRKGFENFLKRSGLKLKFSSSKSNKKYGEIKFYYGNCEGNIIECSFWKKEEIPNGSIMFKGFSNGNLVDCYYCKHGDDNYIYRPNPNAKEVYKPLDIEEHIEYQKING